MFNFVKTVESAEQAKQVDVQKYRNNPQLMAFTLKHRILNTVAFRLYRSLFIRVQALMQQIPNMYAKERKAANIELSILQVHLRRLFNETQKPPGAVVTSARLPNYEEFQINKEAEDEIRVFSLNMVRSMHAGLAREQDETTSDSSHVSEKVKKEVNELVERMKIYGV